MIEENVNEAEDMINNDGTEDGGIDFGIDIELKESKPLKPAEQPQLVYLNEVRFEPEYTFQKGDKKGQVTQRIGFTFQSKNEVERKSVFIMWASNSGDKEKDQKAWERDKNRFAEIYRAFFGDAPAKTFFAGIKGYKDAYGLIAKTLNEGREGGKPIYKDTEGKAINVWLIPVYFGSNVDLPLFNFIEAVRYDTNKVPKRPLIEVLPSHNIKRQGKGGGGANIAGVDSGVAGGNFNIDDLPNF